MLNLIILITAITFEVCGDASIRIGLRGSQLAWFLVGAALVVCYGMIISLPTWSFGRTMGVYIALFFIISQIVASTMLKERLAAPTIVGGLLIVSGGLIILLWHPH